MENITNEELYQAFFILTHKAIYNIVLGNKGMRVVHPFLTLIKNVSRSNLENKDFSLIGEFLNRYNSAVELAGDTRNKLFIEQIAQVQWLSGDIQKVKCTFNGVVGDIIRNVQQMITTALVHFHSSVASQYKPSRAPTTRAGILTARTEIDEIVFILDSIDKNKRPPGWNVLYPAIYRWQYLVQIIERIVFAPIPPRLDEFSLEDSIFD